jgi:hypothetical protein
MIRRRILPVPTGGRRRGPTLALAAGAGVALLVGGAPGASAASACPDSVSPPAAVGAERAVAAIACLVNHERMAAGLGSVSLDPRVRAAAQRHAEDMVARSYFAHESPEGGDPGTRLIAAGYLWSAYGENIAAGQQTPEEVMASWLDSPTHCHTLMTPGYTVGGYGIAPAADGPYWVQDFARGLATGLTTTPAASPACPRTPAPFGGTAPAAGPSRAPAAIVAPTAGPPPAVATARALRPSVRARRSGRRLRVAVVLPTGSGGTITVRVRQRGRTVHARTLRRRPAGTTLRLVVRLRTAGRGRVVVRAGGSRAVTTSFG